MKIKSVALVFCLLACVAYFSFEEVEVVEVVEVEIAEEIIPSKAVAVEFYTDRGLEKVEVPVIMPMKGVQKEIDDRTVRLVDLYAELDSYLERFVHKREAIDYKESNKFLILLIKNPSILRCDDCLVGHFPPELMDLTGVSDKELKRALDFYSEGRYSVMYDSIQRNILLNERFNKYSVLDDCLRNYTLIRGDPRDVFLLDGDDTYINQYNDSYLSNPVGVSADYDDYLFEGLLNSNPLRIRDWFDAEVNNPTAINARIYGLLRDNYYEFGYLYEEYFLDVPDILEFAESSEEDLTNETIYKSVIDGRFEDLHRLPEYMLDSLSDDDVPAFIKLRLDVMRSDDYKNVMGGLYVGDELSDAVLRIVKNNKGMVFDEVMSKVILTDEMRDFFVDVISDELIDYSNEYKINNHGLIPSDNSGSVMDDFILEIKAHSLWLNFYKYLNAESAKKISDRVGIKSDYHIFLGRRYEDGVDVSDYVSEELKSVTDSKFLESANYMELAIKGDFELRDVYYSRLIEIASGDMVGINVAAFLNSARRNLSVDEYKKVYSVLRNK